MDPKIAAEMDGIRQRVAANVDAQLANQRWSRRAAANELGFTQRYVNSRMNGEVDMSATDLAIFAELLNVSVDSFFVHAERDDVIRIGATGGRSKHRPLDYLFPSSSVVNLAEYRATKGKIPVNRVPVRN